MAGVANEPNLVDYLTLGASFLAPLVGALTAVWTLRRRERELVDVAVTWNFAGNPQEHDFDEYPFLYVHNRGDKPIAIVDLYYRHGIFRPKRLEGIAMDYEDPTDIHFPYVVEPGKSHRFLLDPHPVVSVLGGLSRWYRLAHWVRRDPIWVEIQTMANTRRRTGAATAAPWKHRPDWLK